jgi:parallel beta-helix repeat protein
MKKKIIYKGLVIGIILLFVGASVVTSMGVNVVERQDLQGKKTSFEDYNSNGNILYVGGEGPNNYTKIQDAINNAIDGDTVFVYNDSSPYYESIIVDKAINLVGEDKDTTIIAGQYGCCSLNGLAYDPITDKLYGASSYSLYEIDMNFGNQTYIGDFNTGGLMIGISFDNFGNCYGVDIGTDNLYSIDTITGEASLIGSFGINLNYAQDCAYDRGNEILYLSAYNVGDEDRGAVNDSVSGNVKGYGGELYICDTETANLTLVGAFENGAEVDGFAIPYGAFKNGAEVDGFAIPYEQNKTLEKRFDILRFRKEVNLRSSRYEPFYGYCAFDPTGQMDDYTISFFSDHPENLTTIAYTQSNNFIAGSDWVNDTWFGVEYGTGRLYKIDPETGDMDAIGYGADVVRVTADWVNISGFSIKPSGYYFGAGICVYSNFNTIIGNNILDNLYGIELDYCINNIINGNIFSSNWKYGIWLSDSMNNTITGNTISNSYSTKSIGIYLSSSNSNNFLGNSLLNTGIFVENSYCNNVENNTVNGKLLVYMEDESDKIIDYEVGQVILVNCGNITAENLVLSYTYVGIELWGTNNSTIGGNECSTNQIGIYISHSNSGNIITGNNITNNNKGIEIDCSNGNSIMGNTFSSNFDYGIMFSGSMNNIIEINNFTNICYSCICIYFDKSSGNTIASNNFANIEYYDWFSGRGIYFDKSSGNNITGNNISKYFWYGMYLLDSNYNSINSNTIYNNYEGISLYSSNDNIISDNAFFNDGLVVRYSYHNIVVNNTVNGKSLLYLEELSNIFLNEDVGQIILVDCTNITIFSLNLSNTTVGILLWSSNNCLILNNNINNNKNGIITYYSNYNTIVKNNIINNKITSGSVGVGIGIYFDKSSDNTISDNNLTYNWDCILIYESINNTFMYNNIKSNKDGMYIYECSNITIIGNNITYNGHDWWVSGGIQFDKSYDNTIIDNNITYNWKYGITLLLSSNNNIARNFINENCYLSNPLFGITFLDYSNNNTIIDNIISDNGWGGQGIGFFFTSNNNILNNSLLNNSLYVENSYYNNVVNNTVNGKPLVYMEDKSDKIIDYEVGQIILVNCDNITAENLVLSNLFVGIELWGTNNSIISNINCSNNCYGLVLFYCSSNTIKDNIITDINYEYGFGIIFLSGESNTISGNTITNTTAFLGGGIFLSGASNTVSDNTIINNTGFLEGGGIFLSGVSNTISNNIIINNNNFGIKISGYNNNIMSNIISNNTGDIISSGIILTGMSNTVSGNIITNNNYCGIWLSGHSNNIFGNNITNNDYGIRFFGDSNTNIISDNTITNNRYYGVYQYDSSAHNNIFSDNTITNNNYSGINLYKSNNNIISGNTVTNNNKCGISFYGDKNTICDNNITKNSGYGSIKLGGFNNTISGNNITNNNGYGINVVGFNNTIFGNNITNNNGNGIDIEENENNTIYGNNITNNMCGISIGKSQWQQAYNNTVFGNNISNNDYGINITCGYYNNIINNTITNNNDYGVDIGISSNNNTIYHNNFINNTINAFSWGDNIWDDGKYGNYWSDYKDRYPFAIPKLSKPWMWNIPYTIYAGAGNKDNCPLIKPFNKPRNRIFVIPFQNILEHYMVLFMILQLILNRLGQ